MFVPKTTQAFSQLNAILEESNLYLLLYTIGKLIIILLIIQICVRANSLNLDASLGKQIVIEQQQRIDVAFLS